MKLTKEQAIQEHRKMWNWIADRLENGDAYDIADLKEYYLEGSIYRKEDIINNCFCCHYAEGNCDNCPLKWGTEDKVTGYFCEDGIDVYNFFNDRFGCIPDKINSNFNSGLWYIAYELSQDGYYKEAAVTAREIANLPEKEE